MTCVLIVGLDSLAEKITQNIDNSKYEIFGFDFDVDKMLHFNQSGYIKNNPKIILNELLKLSDIIILNTEFINYPNVFKLSPFIKNDALIINTNSYKGNMVQINNILGSKNSEFIPCNFALFPYNVMMNYDKSSKMTQIMRLSSFFRDGRISTSVLSQLDNDKIMAKILHIPFIFDKLFTKEPKYFNFMNYNFIYQDILLNRTNILIELDLFLDKLPEIRYDHRIIPLIDENNIKNLRTPVVLDRGVDHDIASKILIEKVFISSIVDRTCEEYFTLPLYNFEYKKYEKRAIIEYILSNKNELDMNYLLIKERVINLQSLLRFDDISVTRLIRSLNNR